MSRRDYVILFVALGALVLVGTVVVVQWVRSPVYQGTAHIISETETKEAKPARPSN